MRREVRLEHPARGQALATGQGVPAAEAHGPPWPGRYPHDVVNHLSCDEARNHYGGVVSLIPIILDLMKEWIAHSEKLPRKALQHVSGPDTPTPGCPGAPVPSAQATSSQARVTKHPSRQLTKGSLKPRGVDQGCSKPPWRPPGGKL